MGRRPLLRLVVVRPAAGTGGRGKPIEGLYVDTFKVDTFPYPLPAHPYCHSRHSVGRCSHLLDGRALQHHPCPRRDQGGYHPRALRGALLSRHTHPHGLRQPRHRGGRFGRQQSRHLHEPHPSLRRPPLLPRGLRRPGPHHPQRQPRPLGYSRLLHRLRPAAHWPGGASTQEE